MIDQNSSYEEIYLENTHLEGQKQTHQLQTQVLIENLKEFS